MKNEDLIEVVIQNGVQLAYYKGYRLPYMMSSKITDIAGESLITAEFVFPVCLKETHTKTDLTDLLYERDIEIISLKRDISTLNDEIQTIKNRSFLQRLFNK